MTRLLLFLLLVCSSHLVSAQDFTWTEPSRIGSAGSMPLGGGDIGMNVWVDAASNNTYFYLSQSGCFDENNTLLKLGRVRVSCQYSDGERDSTPPFVAQTLHVEEGYMTIQLGADTLMLWVDTQKPVVHIELQNGASRPAELSVVYESWREEDLAVTKAECQMTSWKWILHKGTKTYADSISRNRIVTPESPVWFYHQNRDTTVFDYCVMQQRLDDYSHSLYNPLIHRIFGGRITMDPGRKHAQIVLCNQQSSLSEWWQQVTQTETSIAVDKDRSSARQWWKEYMNRSVFDLPQGTTDATLSAALRNYRLFRFMLGCNAKGAWPTKFNGSIFTFVTDSTDCEEQYVKPFPRPTSNPDFRKWGGGTHTAQNQRLVYWGMLKSGDTEMMVAQLEYYLRLLPTAELRSQVYWGHEGACFTEQMENFGLPNPAEYGKHPDKKGNGQDPGVENNRWLEYEWDTALEFCQMALDIYRYTGKDISRYEPLILSCLRFFDQHYPDNDERGKMIIYPGSGCETYKIARNPASTIAALRCLCQSYLAYRDNAEVRQLLGRIPPLPVYIQQGRECLAPAESWERINNVESPQLYPVWPWRQTGVWQQPDTYVVAEGTPAENLFGLAYNTYHCDSIALKNRTHIGWKQDNIWAACLGLSHDAYALTMQKLADGPYRFPAFWGPGYDWSPDHNWGGSAVIGLEEMLLQENPETGELFILPAWPKEHDIHFKLFASGGRIVEVTQKDGQILQKIIKKFGDMK